MSWFAVAAAVVVVAAGAVEAKNQREAGKANQAIAENNARLADAAAQDAAVQGAREGQQAAWRTRALIGSQRAALAANGIDSELGTAMDLQDDAALFGGAEESAISLNAARKSWGFGAEALNYRNSGNLARWQGKAQGNVTMMRAVGSALSIGAGAGGGGGGGSAGAGGGSAGSSGSYMTTQSFSGPR